MISEGHHVYLDLLLVSGNTSRYSNELTIQATIQENVKSTYLRVQPRFNVSEMHFSNKLKVFFAQMTSQEPIKWFVQK